jgi:hypothetical protein
MKNFIVHPADVSTNFLAPIYQNIQNPTLTTRGWNMEQIKAGINEHDRTLMMGHGCPNGLFSINQFKTGLYAIGSWCVDALKQKNENVYIWCNADKFVERYELSGFYSGMFISEVSEANFCGLFDVTQDMVDESNDTFAVLLGQYINEPKNIIFKKIRESYGKLIKSNPVANYNWKRLYVA